MPPSSSSSHHLAVDCSSIELFCDEASGCISQHFLDEEEDEDEEDDDDCRTAPAPNYIEDDPSDAQPAVAALIDREIYHMPRCDYSKKYTSQTLDAIARQDAIAWLLKVREMYGFHCLTAALSINYLDRFLSHHQLPKGKAWMMQLLSVACLSLAAKMEETDVPFSLDLQVECECLFEARTIQRMELLVLSTLEWRVNSVTPFSYIAHFIHLLGLSRNTHRHLLASRTNDLLLCVAKEMSFIDFRPCSLAAAAILCAMRPTLPDLVCSESKRRLLNALPDELQASTDTCHHLMSEMFVMTTQPTTMAMQSSIQLIHNCSDNLSSEPPPSPVGVLDASFSTASDCDSALRSYASRQSLLQEQLKLEEASSPAKKKRRV